MSSRPLTVTEQEWKEAQGGTRIIRVWSTEFRAFHIPCRALSYSSHQKPGKMTTRSNEVRTEEKDEAGAPSQLSETIVYCLLLLLLELGLQASGRYEQVPECGAVWETPEGDHDHSPACMFYPKPCNGCTSEVFISEFIFSVI